MGQKAPASAPRKASTQHVAPPRVLIEDWLPAAAIGVECIRERSTGQQPPDKRLHVWWARRPLCASRAAVLGSLVPADFPRHLFERLLGFGECRPDWDKLRSQGAPEQTLREISDSIANSDRSRSRVLVRQLMDAGIQCGGYGCDRAFNEALSETDLQLLDARVRETWGEDVTVIDTMAGGGAIPLESARLGFSTLANEYNPVACSVLEATVDYPFRFGKELAERVRYWGSILRERFVRRVGKFFPKTALGGERPDGYIFAHTVPCPDTGFDTPLVPDWHLLKPKHHTGCGDRCTFAVPVVDRPRGTWTVKFQQAGRGAGQIAKAPLPTYGGGKGISLFSGKMVDRVWQGQQIPADYIKAMAQQGRMKTALYALVIKTPSGLKFAPPEHADLHALDAAAKELARLRGGWEKANIIPTERIPVGDKTGDASDKESRGNDKPLKRGQNYWVDMFTPRQLLCMGVLIEELRGLREEITRAERADRGEAITHLLAFTIDKMANYNSSSSFWHAIRQTLANTFDRHDYAFKLTHAEMAPCNAGSGLAWAIENVIEPWEKVATLPRHRSAKPIEISMGSATNLPQIADRAMTAVVVDPPYDDNVQYSELADFFYVWLKRTQGDRRPEWFSTYLCEHDQEAVVNVTRFKNGRKKTKDAKLASREFYRKLMTETFEECRRILRDDGVLTVMFTHKKQEAWEALFTSLIRAGFQISATWPVKTESEHSLHQAKKNAAQSTVILVARKRSGDAGAGYFDTTMEQRIRHRARSTAERLRDEGLNPVDQLVGSFGPAIEVYSQYDEVRTDTGQPVGVDKAIDLASDAVSKWRIEQLASRGLDGVEAEGQFALLCWDVLGAAEFRFNEAKLLGHAVGMDVDQLVTAGLVTKEGDKIKILSARDRRRAKPLEPDEVEELLYGTVTIAKKQKKKDGLKVHPNDTHFRTALDACHALALRYAEAAGGKGGIGNAKALARQQNWTEESNVARLMQALVNAAPQAVRFPKMTAKGKEDPNAAATKFPEFRAWHTLLPELFGFKLPEWKEREVERGLFAQRMDGQAELDEEPDEESDEEEQASEEED